MKSLRERWETIFFSLHLKSVYLFTLRFFLVCVCVINKMKRIEDKWMKSITRPLSISSEWIICVWDHTVCFFYFRYISCGEWKRVYAREKNVNKMTNSTTTTTTYFSSYKFEHMLTIKFDPTFLPIVATSFTLFLILYKYINPFLSNLLVKDYQNFTDTQKIDWSTRYW